VRGYADHARTYAGPDFEVIAISLAVGPLSSQPIIAGLALAVGGISPAGDGKQKYRAENAGRMLSVESERPAGALVSCGRG
jgi:hypothetical protein